MKNTIIEPIACKIPVSQFRYFARLFKTLA